MRLEECQSHLYSGGHVRVRGWVPDIVLRFNFTRGWEASVGGGVWTTETGMLLSPANLFSSDWEEV